MFAPGTLDWLAWRTKVRGAAIRSVKAAGRAAGTWSFRALTGWIVDQALADRERWILWLPAIFGLGVGAYFLLPHEPALWFAPLLAFLAASLAWRFRDQQAVMLAAMVFIALSAGFGLATWRTASLTAPVLEKRLGPVWVTGRAFSVDPLADGERLTLDSLVVERLLPTATPARIRVSVRKAGDSLHPGDWVTVRAILLPPPDPVVPGGFDFSRLAWFQQLGAVGFATVAPRRIEPPARDAIGSNILDPLRVWLSLVQQQLTRRITDVLPGPTGAIAAALMTGERGAIPDALNQAYQDSGLAHLLSISGIHLVLVAGILFFLVRAGLALIPPVALRYPIKKWAAVAALLGAYAYMLLSGSAVATQRSFIMTGLIFVGVLLDRSAISMRSVAWAALFILIFYPESLFDAGFQMSFAAVVALIAGYEWLAPRFAAWKAEAGWFRIVLLQIAGIGLTTLIAGTASAPFAAYHFNRFVDFGLVANLVAVPLTSIWIMPLAVAAFVLMPLHLEWIALVPLGWGVDAVNWVARTVAGWQGAVLFIPTMPDWGLLAFVIGGLWLCLWRGRWRCFGAAGIAVGLISPWLIVAPDLLIDGDGKLTAVKSAGGGLMLSSMRPGATTMPKGMTPSTWTRRAGLAMPEPWPRRDASADGTLRCDALGCLYRSKGFLVALPRDPAAVKEDCRIADIVVASVPVGGRCSGPRIVVDRFDLWRQGAYAIWINPDGTARMETVRGSRGERPWVRQPLSRRAWNEQLMPVGEPALALPPVIDEEERVDAEP